MPAAVTGRAATRFACLLAAGWSCVVAAFAFVEYRQGAAGYGVTTHAVVSGHPVGFVASHPIFATTIHANPVTILILIVLPIALIFAARLALPTVLRSGKR